MSPEEKAKAIGADPRFNQIRAKAEAVANSQAPRGRKYILLAKLADQFTETIKPHVPCRRGCSACCHQAVGITENEAKLLELASGRAMVKLDRTIEEQGAALDGIAKKYYNVPCPFLKGNECSVYEFRPMACRMHHSLQETAHECRTDAGEAYDIPIIAMLGFEREMVMATGVLFIRDQMADIRDFFPAEGGADAESTRG